ncbi:DNA-binding transcriptional regulator BolA [Methylobacterium jeotgali]|uniref:DNA-binding transcriptional regulator BolA n=3 Tax=Pseudomonadota TaxID=1224 RepID=A0ABQ4ST95_9HYPH|nr:BolA family transcriptional regulator [Methylobacterium sp.]GJE05048.1 DNA-binding transcriptional regulator BolA [Methylobacterium jeotgali]
MTQNAAADGRMPPKEPLRDWIARTLEAALAPTRLEVVDESHLHAGHAGSREGGETHYRVDVVSEAFAGKSRVERHRLVNGLLEEAFRRGLHALAVRAKAPGEA